MIPLLFSTLYCFSVSGKDIAADARKDIGLDLDVYQCFYKGCFDPDAMDVTGKTRPENFAVWSNALAWDFAEEGWGGFNNFLPSADENVKIPSGKFIMISL